MMRPHAEREVGAGNQIAAHLAKGVPPATQLQREKGLSEKGKRSVNERIGRLLPLSLNPTVTYGSLEGRFRGAKKDEKKWNIELDRSVDKYIYCRCSLWWYQMLGVCFRGTLSWVGRGPGPPPAIGPGYSVGAQIRLPWFRAFPAPAVCRPGKPSRTLRVVARVVA